MIRYFPPGGRPQPVSGIGVRPLPGSDIGSGGRPTSGNLFAMGRPYGQVAPRSAYTGPGTITPADVYREDETETRLAKDAYLRYLNEQVKKRQEQEQEYEKIIESSMEPRSAEFESRYGTPATAEYLSAYSPERLQGITTPAQESLKSFSDFLKTYSRGQYKVSPEGKLYMGTLGVGSTARLPQQPQQQPRPVYGFLGRASAPRPAMSSYAAR